MPLHNRVAPTGEIVAVPARGLMMGNRGCLHGYGRELGVSRWRSKLWICCVLDWQGRRRDPMPPGRWTALFFTDEASALAAGHRPCAYCRRPDYLAFAEGWRAGAGLPRRPWAVDMDAVLHAQRVQSRTRRKITWPARISELPDGAMVRRDGDVGLLAGGALYRWSWAGYEPGERLNASALVEVLTPPAIVTAIAAGYRPMVHPSAAGASRREGLRVHGVES